MDWSSQLVNWISNPSVSINPTASTTKVTATNVGLLSVQVAVANPDRKGFIIWNNSSNSAYVSFGTTSSSSTPVQIIPTFTSWVVITGVIWTGPIAGIRNAGSGNLVVTELLS